MTGGEKLQGAFSVGLIELKASHVQLLLEESDNWWKGFIAYQGILSFEGGTPMVFKFLL